MSKRETLVKIAEENLGKTLTVDWFNENYPEFFYTPDNSSSKYLDENVNRERTSFNIEETQRGLFNNVSKSFCKEGQAIDVLDNISFSIKEGEIIAIIGPSGCGKSTILNLISNLIKPTSGNILIDGEIGYMFQKDDLFEYRNVYKNVILGLEIKKKLNEEVETQNSWWGMW